MHIVQLSSLLAAAGASHSTCAVSCKPLISSCLFNGTAAMQSYPLPRHARTHIHTQSLHPTLLYSHTPSQAKHIKCASVVAAAGLMNNAQKQKTRPSFYYLILFGGDTKKPERERKKKKKKKNRQRDTEVAHKEYALLKIL